MTSSKMSAQTYSNLKTVLLKYTDKVQIFTSKNENQRTSFSLNLILGGDIKHSRGRKTRSEGEEDSLIVYQ